MVLAAFLFLLVFVHAYAQTDPSTALGAGPLPSWNDGAAKKAITEFVKTTTEKGSPRSAPTGSFASKSSRSFQSKQKHTDFDSESKPRDSKR